MTFLPALLLVTVPVAAPSSGTLPVPSMEVAVPRAAGQRFAQMRIEKRVIIRVPRRAPRSAAAAVSSLREQAAPESYREKRIGRCLPMDSILGVRMFGERHIDLLTTDRHRVRARLEKKCEARNFYSGFYMEKTGDGKICANRDVLHSRTGMKCEIDRFRRLVPE